MPRGDQTFHSNINFIRDEISSSIKWDRPSILIAIVNDHWVKIKARNALIKIFVDHEGFRVENINLASLEEDQIVPILQSMPAGNMVHFAFNLLDESATSTYTYRALNMHRETLIDRNVKIIFWVTRSEADLLPIHALDFWAFRHRVFYFFDSRKVKNTSMGARMMLWGDYEETTSYPELLQEISELKKKIGNVFDNERPKILGLLAKAYWKIGDLKQSYKFTEEGMAACGQQLTSPDHLNLWMSKSAHSFLSGDLKIAQNYLEEAVNAFKNMPFIVLNIALLLLFASRKKNGVDLAGKMVEVLNIHPSLLGQVGYIFFLSGDLYASKKWFELACESGGRFDIALSVCKGRIANSLPKITNFHSHSSGLEEACLELVKKNTLYALDLLRKEIQQNRETAGTLLNNPNLWISVYPDDLGKLLKDL